MIKYPKINSMFQRDEGGIFTDVWAEPEFGALKYSKWEVSEKIDGTNIRIGWDGKDILIGGRSAKSIIPDHLKVHLINLFTAQKLYDVFGEGPCDVVLFGEGYGHKIQKHGDKYSLNNVNFILFDININGIWLERINCISIAMSLGIDHVPIMNSMSLVAALDIIKTQVFHYSRLSEHKLRIEGLVLKAPCGLLNRKGERIITKIKYRDFKR